MEGFRVQDWQWYTLWWESSEKLQRVWGGIVSIFETKSMYERLKMERHSLSVPQLVSALSTTVRKKWIFSLIFQSLSGENISLLRHF